MSTTVDIENSVHRKPDNWIPNNRKTFKNLFIFDILGFKFTLDI